MSGTAATVAQVEMGVNLKDPRTTASINGWLGLAPDAKLIRYWRLDNFAAKPSSGSNKQAGMIIVPCSMGTMGAIASGAERISSTVPPTFVSKKAANLSSSLVKRRITRSISRTCSGSPTPAHRILPASPGFYHRPKTIDDLVEHLCFRILDQFDIPHSKKTQWTGEEVIMTDTSNAFRTASQITSNTVLTIRERSSTHLSDRLRPDDGSVDRRHRLRARHVHADVPRERQYASSASSRMPRCVRPADEYLGGVSQVQACQRHVGQYDLAGYVGRSHRSGPGISLVRPGKDAAANSNVSSNPDG